MIDGKIHQILMHRQLIQGKISMLNSEGQSQTAHEALCQTKQYSCSFVRLRSHAHIQKMDIMLEDETRVGILTNYY